MKTQHAEVSQKNKYIVCWVDTPESVKPGYSITLKDMGGWWLLDKIDPVTIEKSEINCNWQVEGL